MKIPDQIDTSRAERNYVVANTPSFLVRRFKEDKASILLSQNLSETELLKLYVHASSHEPTSLREVVTPYLCLIALSLKPEAKYLRQASSFKTNENYKWLPVFTQIVIDEFRPTSFVVNAVQALPQRIFVGSDAAANFSAFKVPNS